MKFKGGVSQSIPDVSVGDNITKNDNNTYSNQFYSVSNGGFSSSSHSVNDLQQIITYKQGISDPQTSSDANLAVNFSSYKPVYKDSVNYSNKNMYIIKGDTKPITLLPQAENTLSVDMLSLYETLLPTAESAKRREYFVNKIETLLNAEYPEHSIKVHLFGSSMNDLGSSNSDVDLCVTTEWNGLEKVQTLAKVFRRLGMKKVNCVPKAKVPIVRLWDPELHLACDLNVNNTLALHNTRLIKTYVNIDPRVRPLAMTLKHWAKRRALNDAAKGGTLSTYTWTIMILNFLQMREPPILPVLHQMDTGTEHTFVDGFDASFYDDVESLRGFGDANKESVGGLLFAFFRRFAFDFDYDHHVISIRQGKYLTKVEKGWDSRGWLLCVEEPFNTARNLGNSADVVTVRGLIGEFKRAFCILYEKVSLEFCCKQYHFPKFDHNQQTLQHTGTWNNYNKSSPNGKRETTTNNYSYIKYPNNGHSIGGAGGDRRGGGGNNYDGQNDLHEHTNGQYSNARKNNTNGGRIIIGQYYNNSGGGTHNNGGLYNDNEHMNDASINNEHYNIIQSGGRINNNNRGTTNGHYNGTESNGHIKDGRNYNGIQNNNGHMNNGGINGHFNNVNTNGKDKYTINHYNYYEQQTYVTPNSSKPTIYNQYVNNDSHATGYSNNNDQITNGNNSSNNDNSNIKHDNAILYYSIVDSEDSQFNNNNHRNLAKEYSVISQDDTRLDNISNNKNNNRDNQYGSNTDSSQFTYSSPGPSPYELLQILHDNGHPSPNGSNADWNSTYSNNTDNINHSGRSNSANSSEYGHNNHHHHDDDDVYNNNIKKNETPEEFIKIENYPKKQTFQSNSNIINNSNIRRDESQYSSDVVDWSKESRVWESKTPDNPTSNINNSSNTDVNINEISVNSLKDLNSNNNNLQVRHSTYQLQQHRKNNNNRYNNKNRWVNNSNNHNISKLDSNKEPDHHQENYRHRNQAQPGAHNQQLTNNDYQKNLQQQRSHQSQQHSLQNELGFSPPSSSKNIQNAQQQSHGNGGGGAAVTHQPKQRPQQNNQMGKKSQNAHQQQHYHGIGVQQSQQPIQVPKESSSHYPQQPQNVQPQQRSQNDPTPRESLHSQQSRGTGSGVQYQKRPQNDQSGASSPKNLQNAQQQPRGTQSQKRLQNDKIFPRKVQHTQQQSRVAQSQLRSENNQHLSPPIKESQQHVPQPRSSGQSQQRLQNVQLPFPTPKKLPHTQQQFHGSQSQQQNVQQSLSAHSLQQQPQNDHLLFTTLKEPQHVQQSLSVRSQQRPHNNQWVFSSQNRGNGGVQYQQQLQNDRLQIEQDYPVLFPTIKESHVQQSRGVPSQQRLQQQNNDQSGPPLAKESSYHQPRDGDPFLQQSQTERTGNLDIVFPISKESQQPRGNQSPLQQFYQPRNNNNDHAQRSQANKQTGQTLKESRQAGIQSQRMQSKQKNIKK
ncbi:847_t:CDS:2 [Ambispora gerdemannii]|uniref:polynucleotide adenylyltransferase n=1 Tax=Ambispora gerdemannii TaxID=144530 RepID=A0A9N8VM25_9GLOM|nr:847_t:CDS:2 [Ambispora gerdemannii]